MIERYTAYYETFGYEHRTLHCIYMYAYCFSFEEFSVNSWVYILGMLAPSIGKSVVIPLMIEYNFSPLSAISFLDVGCTSLG